MAKAIRESSVDVPSLIGLLKRRLKTSEVREPLNPSSWLRASGFADMCLRAEVIRYLAGVSTTSDWTADSAVTFAHGSGIHWALQNKILSAADVLRGVWRCETCGLVVGGPEKPSTAMGPQPFVSEQQKPRPTVCTQCAQTEFVYVEQFFGDAELKIGGHPDGFLEMPGVEGLGVVEAKSISSRGIWEVRSAPYMSHVIQSQIYMMLTGLKWAIVLYWDKGGFGTGCLVEHVIERDEDTIQKIRKMIVAMRQGMTNSWLPEKICETSDCPRAKKCNVADMCFEQSDHVVAISKLFK